MFKSSQMVDLNMKKSTSPAASTRMNETDNFCMFGKYQKTPDIDKHNNSAISQVFISPELTDTTRVQLLHFPNGVMRLNEEVSFIIKRNSVKGNFEVKLETPSNHFMYIPIKGNDPERLEVRFNIEEIGLYKVHIKCNSVLLPRSPFIIVAISGSGSNCNGNCDGQLSSSTDNFTKIKSVPDFKSDASKVTQRGLKNCILHLDDNVKKEEQQFIVDASQGGNNILFVGICGPNGQCDEIVIKHMGHHVYKVNYRINDPGDYVLAIKWGDNHIPGSPFTLTAL